AAAGRADEHHELAVANLQVEARDRGGVRAGIPALCLLESDCCHERASPSPAGTCRTIRSEVTTLTVSANVLNAHLCPQGSQRAGTSPPSRSAVPSSFQVTSH